jgi:hypothetical protein
MPVNLVLLEDGKIFSERRKRNNRKPNITKVDIDNRKCDRRKNRSFREISENMVASYLHTLKWEQEQLVEFFKDQEKKKLTILNSFIGTFTVYISALMAITFFGNKATQETLGPALINSYYLMYFIVLLGLGVINTILIKYLMSLRAGSILSARQMNCMRQAIDNITYSIFEGKYPENAKDLENKGTSYFQIFGKHRKLPLHNDSLKQSIKSHIKPADDFTIVVVSAFTFAMLLSPVAYYWLTGEDSKVTGTISWGIALLFASVLLYIYVTGRKQIMSLCKI